jgi:hypothetical protein
VKRNIQSEAGTREKEEKAFEITQTENSEKRNPSAEQVENLLKHNLINPNYRGEKGKS